ncbi:homoprotocatechuate degradation operon regulator, HpaR [Polaromonas sp.]|nr:homoprotocatechuate degradation operon regulator, HpaR [Polaromonas sp.]
MSTPLRQRNLPQLLLQSREALMKHFRPMLNVHGVTEQQWRILRALLEEGPLEPRQLCERCLISSPSIAGVLTRMQEAGLIERERMDHDQRRVKVSLTARAKKIGKSMAPVIDSQYSALKELIGEHSLQQVYDVLDVLLQRLDDQNEQKGVDHASTK